MNTVCPKCGYERKEIEAVPDYECPSCGVIYDKYASHDEIIQRVKDDGDWSKMPIHMMRKAVDEVIVTTTPMIPGVQVDAIIEIITAEVAFGMNVFKDIFAKVKDVTGGRSKATQNILRDARKQAIFELKKEALKVGADAVVSVDLDYSEFSGGGKSMLFIIASGTAVKLSST